MWTGVRDHTSEAIGSAEQGETPSPRARRPSSLAVIAALAAVACSAPVIAPAPPDGELIAFGGGTGGPRDACFVCHGLDGEGDGVTPRLAGQSEGYLVKQMEDYAGRWRDHPQMSPIAARLDDGERTAVATYYSRLSEPYSQPRLSAGGASLFVEGDQERGLPPCARCHGPQGRGSGLGYPALAGQPAEYISAQLQAWKASKRRNDPQDVMGSIARRLSDAEIDELALYAASLP
jgi:cytochrome c553